MPLCQTYLSLKDKLPVGAETVLVMRACLRDQTFPSKPGKPSESRV